jgi:hypothetical protein
MKRAIQLITDSAAHGARSEEADRFDEQERAILFKRNLHVARRILVPIDLTQESLTTIRQSIRLAQHFGARLTLLHVLSAADFIRNSGSARSKDGPPGGSAASGRDSERARDVGPSCLSKL